MYFYSMLYNTKVFSNRLIRVETVITGIRREL